MIPAKGSVPPHAAQVFRRPVQFCQQGDRAGLCVTQLDAKLVERGIVCAPGSVPTFSAAIAAVERVRFYSGTLPSSGKVCCPTHYKHLQPLPPHTYPALLVFSNKPQHYAKSECLTRESGL